MAGPQAAVAERDLAKLLLNSLDFGLLALDQDSHILFANRKACEIFTADAKQLVGHAAGEVLISRTRGSPSGRPIGSIRRRRASARS